MSKTEKSASSKQSGPTVGEQIWAELKDKQVSVFNLPPQPVEKLVATKRVAVGSHMAEVPDVVCLNDMVFMKLKFTAAIATISEVCGQFNFAQTENGQVMVSRKTASELPKAQQPFVVINR